MPFPRKLSHRDRNPRNSRGGAKLDPKVPGPANSVETSTHSKKRHVPHGVKNANPVVKRTISGIIVHMQVGRLRIRRKSLNQRKRYIKLNYRRMMMRMARGVARSIPSRNRIRKET